MAKIIKLASLPIALVFIGALMNLIVIKINGGMPVLGLQYTASTPYWLFPNHFYQVVPLTESTKLGFLGDVLPYYFSLGDIMMFCGISIFIIQMSVYFVRSKHA